MTNPTPAPDPSPAPAPASRLTFADQFFSEATDFGRDILFQVPELASVVIIPIWQIPQTNLPVGLIKFPADHSPSASELMQITKQLHQCLTGQLERLTAYLQSLDEHAGRIAQKIAENVKNQTSENSPPAG